MRPIPAEVPFFIVMVVLNVVIVAVILRAAWVLPFLPERLQGTGWATAIRATLIGLLLYVPVLILIRETQRAAVRGSAVELSPSQFPEQFETAEDFARTLRLRRRPEIFLSNGNGALNAFAAQATGYDYVVFVQRAVREPVQQQPGRPAVHPRPRDGPTSGCTTFRCGTRLRSPTRSRSRCLGRRCRACGNTPATGMAPTCPGRRDRADSARLRPVHGK